MDEPQNPLKKNNNRLIINSRQQLKALPNKALRQWMKRSRQKILQKNMENSLIDLKKKKKELYFQQLKDLYNRIPIAKVRENPLLRKAMIPHGSIIFHPILNEVSQDLAVAKGEERTEKLKLVTSFTKFKEIIIDSNNNFEDFNENMQEQIKKRLSHFGLVKKNFLSQSVDDKKNSKKKEEKPKKTHQFMEEISNYYKAQGRKVPQMEGNLFATNSLLDPEEVNKQYGMSLNLRKLQKHGSFLERIKEYLNRKSIGMSIPEEEKPDDKSAGDIKSIRTEDNMENEINFLKEDIKKTEDTIGNINILEDNKSEQESSLDKSGVTKSVLSPLMPSPQIAAYETKVSEAFKSRNTASTRHYIYSGSSGCSTKNTKSLFNVTKQKINLKKNYSNILFSKKPLEGKNKGVLKHKEVKKLPSISINKDNILSIRQKFIEKKSEIDKTECLHKEHFSNRNVLLYNKGIIQNDLKNKENNMNLNEFLKSGPGFFTTKMDEAESKYQKVIGLYEKIQEFRTNADRINKKEFFKKMQILDEEINKFLKSENIPFIRDLSNRYIHDKMLKNGDFILKKNFARRAKYICRNGIKVDLGEKNGEQILMHEMFRKNLMEISVRLKEMMVNTRVDEEDLVI